MTATYNTTERFGYKKIRVFGTDSKAILAKAYLIIGLFLRFLSKNQS